MILLSIVIPSWSGRARTYAPRMVGDLHDQIGDSSEVELLCLVDNGLMSIGRKMNILTRMARGVFICGVGDDDEVTTDFVRSVLDAIKAHPDVDVITYDHEYFYDGEYKALIREGVDLPYSTNGESKIYTRSPSNKMVIRREHCLDFEYPELWHGEDTAFARGVLPKLHKEHRIDRVLYKYLYRSTNKSERRGLADKAKGVRCQS